MIETEANEIPEDILLECHQAWPMRRTRRSWPSSTPSSTTIGKPKFTFEKAAVNHDLLDDLCAYGMDQIEYALDTDDKNVREERLTAARRRFRREVRRKVSRTTTSSIEDLPVQDAEEGRQEVAAARASASTAAPWTRSVRWTPRSACCRGSTAPACSPEARPRSSPSAP